MVKFVIKNKNKWGDNLYQQKDDGYIEPPDNKDIWTIWRPSMHVKNLYPNNEIRKYGKDLFLLSSRASKIIPSNPKPSTFSSLSDSWFVPSSIYNVRIPS